MKAIAIAAAVLAAIALAGPTTAIAATKATDAGSKPSSYAPGPHTSNHVYGSPIGRPITGHAASAQHAHKTNSPAAAAHPSRAAPAPRARGAAKQRARAVPKHATGSAAAGDATRR